MPKLVIYEEGKSLRVESATATHSLQQISARRALSNKALFQLHSSAITSPRLTSATLRRKAVMPRPIRHCVLAVLLVLGARPWQGLATKQCEDHTGRYYTCPQSDQSDEYDICCGEDSCCSSRLAGWAIALIVVGAFAAFVGSFILICLCCSCCPGYRRQRRAIHVSNVTTYTFGTSPVYGSPRRESTAYQGM